MLKAIRSSRFTYWILFLYLVVVIWWIYIQKNGLTNSQTAYLFNWFYGLIAFNGGFYSIYVSVKKWGGWSSVLGRGLIFLPLGLISQAFGLQVWTYYNVIAHVEVPYPSLADIGYFALIPAYTLGALMFAQASGGKFSLRSFKGKLFAFIIPALGLFLAYALFVKDIGFDPSNLLKTFLDFGYPLGEILPVSIALFTLTLSRNLLGGTMKSRVLYLVAAFVFQFLTEYAFLYTAGKQTYVNGGWNDIMYATSYMIMSLGLISFSRYD